MCSWEPCKLEALNHTDHFAEGQKLEVCGLIPSELEVTFPSLWAGGVGHVHSDAEVQRVSFWEYWASFNVCPLELLQLPPLGELAQTGPGWFRFEHQWAGWAHLLTGLGFWSLCWAVTLLWWYQCSVWWFVCLDLQCSLSCPLHPAVVPKSWFSLPSAGSVSVHPLSIIWPLFWHPAWRVCTSPAILQALVSIWIPFDVCPAVIVWDTWAQESWAERCGQPWAGKKHPWGDESCELLMCFNRQVKYWLLLCWAHGG